MQVRVADDFELAIRTLRRKMRKDGLARELRLQAIAKKSDRRKIKARTARVRKQKYGKKLEKWLRG